MPVNPFAVGVRSFTDSLARRRADEYEAQDRERRDRLDVENREDRRMALEQRNRELASLDQYRQDQINVREEESRRRDEAAKAEQQAREALGNLLDQYTEAVVAGSEDMKRAIGIKILNMGGKLPPAEPRQPNRPAPVERGGRLLKFDPEKNDWIDVGPVPEKATPSKVKEDPELPAGLQKEMDWFYLHGKTLKESIPHVAQKWNSGEYAQRYPSASLPKTIDYLKRTFTKDEMGFPSDLSKEEGLNVPTPGAPAVVPPAGGTPPPAAPPAAPSRPDLSFDVTSRENPGLVSGFQQLGDEQGANAPNPEDVRRQVAESQARNFAASVNMGPVLRPGQVPVQPPGPKVGEQRVINGVLGVWDGKQWIDARDVP